MVELGVADAKRESRRDARVPFVRLKVPLPGVFVVYSPPGVRPSQSDKTF